MGAPFDELRERTGYEYHVKAVPESVVLAVPESVVLAVLESVVLAVLESVVLAVPESVVLAVPEPVEGPPSIPANSRRKHRSSRCCDAGFNAMVFSKVDDQ
jgi:hypothetical protein